MKKLLLMFLTLIFIIFFTGCDIEFHYNLNIEQEEPYVCEIGDVLPFSNVKFDESTNVIKETALGIYAFEPGEIYIECTQGKYYIIVKEPNISIEYQTEQLLTIGEETDILVSVEPSDKNQTVSFKSMDNNIVTVTEDGKVTAINDGITRIKIISDEYNLEEELTFIVLKEDEKYYEKIVDVIINNKDIILDNGFQSILQGVVNTNMSSLVGVSTYVYERNKVKESDFGSGIIYKMNVICNDGNVIKDVKDINEIDVSKIKSFEYYVITNRHIIYDKYKTKIYTNDSNNEIEATVMEYDDKIDLAVLKFESTTYYPVAKLGDSEDLEKGEFIVSIGHGTGKQYYKSSTFGVVSSVKRYVNTDTNGDNLNDWDSEYIQHDASINECDSGGAILNLKGEIIGINSTKISSLTYNNMAFAIPINLVMDIVKQLEEGIRPQRATLGVQILDITGYWQNPEYYKLQYPGINIPTHIRQGFYVNVVEKGGVAEKAKVQVGDIILEFNNVKIRYSYQVRAELGKFLIGSGQVAEIKVYRNGEVITLYCEF